MKNSAQLIVYLKATLLSHNWEDMPISLVLIKQKIMKKLISRTFVPLFIGGIIYILFRSDNLYMFHWFDLIGIGGFLDTLRQQVDQVNLVDWIIYSLPNGLWLYAFLNLLLIIWNKQINCISLFWLIIPLLLGIGSELGQYIGLLRGTFDVIDLIVCLLATVLPFLTINFKEIEWEKTEFKKVKHSLSIIGCILFVFFAVGSNGPSDAFQNSMIESEEDPVKREKMRRKENFYISHSRTYPTEEQTDSINAVVDSLIRNGEIDTTKI